MSSGASFREAHLSATTRREKPSRTPKKLPIQDEAEGALTTVRVCRGSGDAPHTYWQGLRGAPGFPRFSRPIDAGQRLRDYSCAYKREELVGKSTPHGQSIWTCFVHVVYSDAARRRYGHSESMDCGRGSTWRLPCFIYRRNPGIHTGEREKRNHMSKKDEQHGSELSMEELEQVAGGTAAPPAPTAAPSPSSTPPLAPGAVTFGREKLKGTG